MKRNLFGAALAIALVAPAAHAQMSSPVKFGVAGGITLPTSTNDLSDGVSSGYNVYGTLGFQAPMIPTGLRVDVMYNHLGEKDDNGVTFTNFNATANGVFNLGMAPTMSPYIIGGLGVYNTKIKIEDTIIGDVDESKTSLGVNGGFGLKFNLSGFSTFAEARYHYVFAEDDEKGFENYSIIPISFGIMF